MLKPIIRLFLSLLCVFLLSGFRQLTANAYRKGVSASPQNHIVRSFNLPVQIDDLALRPVHPKTEKKDVKIEDTENEDDSDDFFSFKKYLEVSNYFITVFTARINSSHDFKGLPIGNNPTFTATNSWYLILRVIKI